VTVTFQATVTFLSRNVPVTCLDIAWDRNHLLYGLDRVGMGQAGDLAVNICRLVNFARLGKQDGLRQMDGAGRTCTHSFFGILRPRPQGSEEG
jgi:hypothetical protein